jgi:hypothetical protein
MLGPPEGATTEEAVPFPLLRLRIGTRCGFPEGRLPHLLAKKKAILQRVTTALTLPRGRD